MAAIGARGSIRSLVRKEIDYLSKFESEKRGSSRRTQASIIDVGCDESKSRSGFGFLTMIWKRKKPRGGNCNTNGGFLPSICSMVKVGETSRLIPGYTYRILKDNDAQN